MTTRTFPSELSIEPASAAAKISDFIKAQVRGNSFERVVLGLSGGVDSALVAALCARALGKKNVRAFLLPYKTSSRESLRDATAVANCIGLKTQTIEITAMAEPYIAAQQPDQIRLGNILARLRMIVLFDMAKKNEALVAGTGNKTETYLGYSTLHGDSACSFLPLADLYKSQVWQMAQALELPPTVVDKAPSADLWPGQTDEGEMGIDYIETDRLLYALLDKGMKPAAAVAEGFESGLVRKVVRIIRATQFKRELPPVAYLSAGPPDISHLLDPDFEPDSDL